MVRRAAIAVLLPFLLVGGSFARDIFVNNVDGNDTRDGSSPVLLGRIAGPTRSLERALELATKGDRIVLADTGKAYRESVTLQAGRHSGSSGEPFRIEGNGAVLDGTQPVPPRAWKHVRDQLYRYRPPRMSHQVLYLDGKPATRVTAVPGEGLPELAPLQWCLYDRHLYFYAEDKRLPREYALYFTGLPVGISLYEVRHVRISDLVIQGFQLDGVNAHDSVFDATFAGLTCRGNGRSGISIGGASQVDLVACLIGDNGTAQIRTEGYSRTRLRNCDLVETSAPAVLREGGQVTMLEPDTRN